MSAACGRSITDYKEIPSRDLPDDASLPDKLNAVYARFDNNNTVPCVRAPTRLEDWVILLSEADMSKVFNQVNTRKAAGLDGIPGHILRACADQLAGIFSHFQPFLVPVCNPHS